MNESIKHGVQQVSQELYDKYGKLTASALVEAARPKDSPAHDGFEWNNTKAGHEYRLYQARGWFRRIEIKIESAASPERLINVPRISVESNETHKTNEGEYQLPSVLIQRPDEFQRALDQAQSKFSAAKRALNELYQAAERTDRREQTALIAQMARATEMWVDALQGLH